MAAIADVEDLAKKIASNYQIPVTYTNHHELLKDKEIDAVIITCHGF